VKTEVFSQPIIDMLKPALPIIEVSLLFEIILKAAQARPMQSSMLALLNELH